MKLRTLVVSLALVAGSAGAALADRPGPDWMPAEQVIAKIRQVGYSVIGKIEADDGRWEGEGLKNGQWTEFQADPKTGAITLEKAK